MNKVPPLGFCSPWANTQVWGTIGSGLTPRVQKCTWRARFPALISVGGANRFLEDLSPAVPRNPFFGKVVEAKVVQHVKLGWFQVFPDIQDHLGQAQGHRQTGVGREQGRPQGLNFWESCLDKRCSACKTRLVQGTSGPPGPSRPSPDP